MNYRFVGSNSSIGDSVSLTRYGQAVELTDELACMGIVGGVNLLPAGEFQKVGFAEADLGTFASVGSHDRAPADFLEKKLTAGRMAHELRVRLEGGAGVAAAGEGLYGSVVPEGGKDLV